MLNNAVLVLLEETLLIISSEIISEMTVIISEATVNQSNGETDATQEVCRDRKEFIVDELPKCEVCAQSHQ